MNIGERSIVVRVVRGEFLRICGLTESERETLKNRLDKLFFTSTELLIVRYGAHTILEVEDAGTRHYPQPKRAILTDVLKVRVAHAMKRVFTAST